MFMSLIVTSFVVIFATTMIAYEVDSWIIFPRRRTGVPLPLPNSPTSFFSGSNSNRIHSDKNEKGTTIIAPSMLYQKISSERRDSRQNIPYPRATGSFRNKQKSNDTFYNNNNTTTSLFYINDDETTFVLKTNESVPDPTTISTTKLPIGIPLNAGTFGDIMSQPNNDDVQDGLVTSESYSLEDIYDISSPLDRIALTANGNLQRLFSSYYDAPVVVEMVHCTKQKEQNPKQTDYESDKNPPLSTFSASWNRRVMLKVFDRTFCTADSIVVVHSQEIENLVESGTVGIGQIFRHFNILPEFNLIKAGPTTAGGIWRHYTLESNLVTCSIREVFCNDVWNLSPLSTADDDADDDE